MATSKEVQEFEKQEKKAREIFRNILILLIVWLILLVVFIVIYGIDSDPKWAEYLQWIFASLIGASSYLLWNVAYWHQKIRLDDKKGRADFFKYSLWYASTMVRAPILTIVLMWILTKTKIELGAGTDSINLDFTKLNPYIAIGITFILGYYGRVALSQLDIITKTFFPKAWAMAVQGFEVTAPKILLLKEKFTFTTDPPSDVVWSATPVGSMEADTGIYTAPEDSANENKEVIIRASLKNEPSVTGYKKLTLKTLKIDGKDGITPEDLNVKYTLKSNVIADEELAKATWSVSEGTLSTNTGKEITFTPPKTTEKKVITLEAKVGERTEKMEITLE